MADNDENDLPSADALHHQKTEHEDKITIRDAFAHGVGTVVGGQLGQHVTDVIAGHDAGAKEPTTTPTATNAPSTGAPTHSPVIPPSSRTPPAGSGGLSADLPSPVSQAPATTGSGGGLSSGLPGPVSQAPATPAQPAEPTYNALDQLAASHNSLQQAQQEAEQEAKEREERQHKRREEYERRMAEMDTNRAQQNAEAEAQNRATQAAHQARGDAGYDPSDQS